MTSLILVLQIFLALILGFLSAKKLPVPVQKFIFKILPYFSYLLLISVSLELFQALQQLQHPLYILKPALLIALLTSLGSFLVCLFAYQWLDRSSVKGSISLHLFLKAIKNISYALLALMVGAGIGWLIKLSGNEYSFNSWYLLLVFILLIGVELAHTHFDRAWLSWKILVVPLAAFIGSGLAALLCIPLLQSYTANEILALAQGYGWYSMSGILLSQIHSPQLGSIALLTDLFREVFAILLMYCIGWRFPRSAISSAGATSMDVTLAMVKQSCGTHYVPHAMMSGLILTLLAPLLISFFIFL